MNSSHNNAERQSLILRALWMLLFFFVWQIAEVVLLVVVVAQLVMRALNGKPNEGLRGFGDSLSQYVAQIGRFATFNTDRKPWPMSDWPVPRPAEIETPPPVVPEAPKPESQP
ncbi:MAG: lipase [Pseudomonadales bacterium 32-61-5]|uniref:DUF4389 domain-containing protein n=1 Tax=Stutzerimonas stutzeri TaxID=316 RepID=UPI000BCE2916|nr:DUF4389 domain-containing protein [Stutzerimonas stutzeri]MBF6623247.1 DUF4389 domain-containing protein [Stutzerimonas stutzeri]MCQ4241941.1 DUF4389 domain-containing protein [Stutzerimonas stutzeri]OYW95600.1 MAG: lipase [Pseudomonadales bacterium 32-61-5]